MKCDDGAKRESLKHIAFASQAADFDCWNDVSMSMLFGVNRLMNYADDDDL